jgi:Family of unknown function (DUF6326)
MTSMRRERRALQDSKVPVRLKLSAFWASLMFCYIYGDYFGLYQPGKLQGMLEGRMGPLGPTTQGVLLGTSVLMAIPAVMVFLSLVLTPGLDRWANIILGGFFTVVMLITMPGSWAFYVFLGLVEVALSILIVWHAWKWPRQA